MGRITLQQGPNRNTRPILETLLFLHFVSTKFLWSWVAVDVSFYFSEIIIFDFPETWGITGSVVHPRCLSILDVIAFVQYNMLFLFTKIMGRGLEQLYLLHLFCFSLLLLFWIGWALGAWGKRFAAEFIFFSLKRCPFYLFQVSDTPF